MKIIDRTWPFWQGRNEIFGMHAGLTYPTNWSQPPSSVSHHHHHHHHHRQCVCTGKFREAAQSYVHALGARPASADLWAGLGMTMTALGELELADLADQRDLAQLERLTAALHSLSQAPGT